MVKRTAILKGENDISTDRSGQGSTAKPSKKKKQISRRDKNEIVTLSGAFADWSEEEYKDFLQYIQKVRKELFNRNINLWMIF